MIKFILFFSFLLFIDGGLLERVSSGRCEEVMVRAKEIIFQFSHSSEQVGGGKMGNIRQITDPWSRNFISVSQFSCISFGLQAQTVESRLNFKVETRFA